MTPSGADLLGLAGRADLQPFEHHPELALWVRRLAGCRIEGLSLQHWQQFLDALNAALASSNDTGQGDK